MNYEAYTEIGVTRDFEVFEFVSTGRNGDILKRVAFFETETKNVYNLTFGDVDENNDIDYYAVSDNGDRDKVLATVATIIERYSRRFPDRFIYFEGSTQQRTRLYRMAIGLHWEELSSIYEIWAYQDEEWLPFTKSLKISAFLIKRKKS